jgi:AbrB family looped-hinge helix DNA binding protein
LPTYRTKVGPDGRIALPSALVKKLNIREGAEVEFFVALDGDVFFHAITGVAAGWKGLYPTEIRSPPFSIREMDEAVAEGVVEDYERIRRQAASSPANPGKGRPAAE